MDFAAVTTMLYAELNAASASDLQFWTEAEIIGYADLEMSKLTSGLMLFVDAQDVTGIAGQSTYDLAHTTDDTPADTRFVSLIHAVWGGASLSPATVMEIEARDANWTVTTGTPSIWIGDWLAAGMIVAYPQPTGSATLTVFCQRNAPAITSADTSQPAPDALADLLHLRVLGDARAKRGDAWMPEAAALADGLANVLEAAFSSYYGAAM
jgi:hypothetical protein